MLRRVVEAWPHVNLIIARGPVTATLECGHKVEVSGYLGQSVTDSIIRHLNCPHCGEEGKRGHETEEVQRNLHGGETDC